MGSVAHAVPSPVERAVTCDGLAALQPSVTPRRQRRGDLRSAAPRGPRGCSDAALAALAGRAELLQALGPCELGESAPLAQDAVASSFFNTDVLLQKIDYFGVKLSR